VSILLRLLIPLLFAASAQAAPETHWYQVEVLVFDRADLEEGLQSEFWPADPGWPVLRGGAELVPMESATDGPPSAHDALEYAAVDLLYQDLLPQADRLQRARSYRLLAHLAWIQPAEPGKPGPAALITDPDDPERYQPLNYLPELAAPALVVTPPLDATPAALPDALAVETVPAPDALPADVVLPDHGAIGLPLAAAAESAGEGNDTGTVHLISYLGPPQLRVFGRVRLIRKRYLHLELDLLYRPEAERLDERLSPERWPTHPQARVAEDPAVVDSGMPPAGTVAAADVPPMATEGETTALSEPMDPWTVSGFRLKQSRRVRSGELHYFDHPLFGVLARIKKVEPPGSEEEAPGAFPGAPAP